MDSTQKILQNMLIKNNIKGIELLPLHTTPARIHYFSEDIPLGTNPHILRRGIDYIITDEIPLFMNTTTRLYIGKLLKDVNIYLPSNIKTFAKGVRILVYIRHGHIVVALNPDIWDKRSIAYVQNTFNGFLKENRSSNRSKTRGLTRTRRRGQTRKSRRV